MGVILLLLGLAAGLLLGVLLGLRVASRGGADRTVAALAARGEDRAVIRQGLDRLAERMGDLEAQRASWQGQLHQQVDDVRRSTESLRAETGALATALRRPHVRGQWGELHLRRTVELAGLVEHCDFTEQVSMATADGVRRPDLVVHLAGGHSIVVDAKAPLDAYLDALAAAPEEQPEHLRRHARQLRAQVDALSAKSYWAALPAGPAFVVLFVPAESCLAAALEADAGLIEYAATRRVVLASPTTLIALLRTVAHGWTTVALVDATREIHELGRELHERLGRLGGHLDKVGRSLKAAVESYNAAIGSLESRVLVTARQFDEIGVGDAPLGSPDPVVVAPRPLTAAELLEAVTPPSPDLPDSPDLGTGCGAGPDPRETSGESRRSSA